MTFAYRVNYLQVPLSDLAPCLLYFLDLLLQNFLRLGVELFDHLRDVDVNGWIAGSDGHDVQLRVGGGGHIHSGGAGQLGVLGAVGGQQDRGGEDAHRDTLLSRGHPMEISVLIVSRTLVSTRVRRRHNAFPQGLQRLIHPSTWKWNSRNFA
jgi:hypothetical protein